MILLCWVVRGEAAWSGVTPWGERETWSWGCVLIVWQLVSEVGPERMDRRAQLVRLQLTLVRGPTSQIREGAVEAAGISVIPQTALQQGEIAPRIVLYTQHVQIAVLP